ncbi:MAG: penicillin-binding protein 2, partial [Candidatus Pacearchaeota archaeon]|nr:penicillin-binding protein 2 [Candidatus Pacearchaeota archaeon]
IFLQGRRGELVPVATTRETALVFLSPPEVENPEETAQVLAGILNISPQEILSRALRENSLFEVLKKDIPADTAFLVESLKLPGVYVEFEGVRVYPEGEFAAQMLGFTNADRQGQYGVEEAYNRELAGKEGFVRLAANPGTYLRPSGLSEPEDGQDLVLTIDYNIQREAERLLGAAREDLNFESGSALVVEPSSGKVLAMATVPSFDPNQYGKVSDLSVFQNPITQGLFEPGSIFKPITMASAIEEGRVLPTTTYMDTGRVQIGGASIENYDQRMWGERTMTEVLEYSINTGAVFAERQLGNKSFLSYIERFGFLRPTGIDLPGEAFSENREFRKGYEINFVTAAFGQGIEMTPLQIARAFTALANNGVMTTPYVAELAGDRALGPQEDPQRVISAKTASQITSMLVSVTEHGYAKSARVPGYYVAGKTGTAQISYSALGIPKAGYSEKTNQSFIGYAPAFNPRFLVLIKLQNPETNTAEYSAVPIFQKLAKYIIDYYEIPPDYEP